MSEDISRVFRSAGSVLSFLPRSAAFFYNNQLQTMKTVSRLDGNIFLMDYKYDYDIDDLLKNGISSTAQLLGYACKKTLFGVKLLSLGEGSHACTTFNAFNESGDHLLGRNFDYKEAPCMVVWTHPEGGYASISVVDCNFMLYGNFNKPLRSMNRLQTLLAPYCCVDGMNEKGLAVAVVEIKSKPAKQNTGKTNITTTTVIRAVLDKAATVDEAVEIFRSFDMHDAFFCAYHYQITDAYGKSVILEYVDNEIKLIYPEEREEARPVQSAANFFISPGGDNTKGFGYERAQAADERLALTGGVLSERSAMNLLNDVHLNYRHRLGYQVITLWSAVYNSNKLTVDICARLNYNRTYTFSVTEPCKVIK